MTKVQSQSCFKVENIITKLCPRCHQESNQMAREGECYGCGYPNDYYSYPAILVLFVFIATIAGAYTLWSIFS